MPDTRPQPKKRNAWEPQRVFDFLEKIKDNPILHLAVHRAFVCSLRAGKVVGINVGTIDFQLVAESSGQSPEVLMSDCNEALDSEKRTLSLLVETSFYPKPTQNEQKAPSPIQASELMEQLQ